jgi:hypothetical protein
MPRPQNDILLEIDCFTPDPPGHWLGLQALLDELWQSRASASSLPTLFRVFERFPDEDGSGVFWSILHGIESMDVDYEALLRESLSRQSSELGRIMLRRLEKSKAPIK